MDRSTGYIPLDGSARMGFWAERNSLEKKLIFLSIVLASTVFILSLTLAYKKCEVYPPSNTTTTDAPSTIPYSTTTTSKSTSTTSTTPKPTTTTSTTPKSTSTTSTTPKPTTTTSTTPKPTSTTSTTHKPISASSMPISISSTSVPVTSTSTTSTAPTSNSTTSFSQNFTTFNTTSTTYVTKPLPGLLPTTKSTTNNNQSRELVLNTSLPAEKGSTEAPSLTLHSTLAIINLNMNSTN